MFNTEQKMEISKKIQHILEETHNPELPTGEINFLLHVDGAEGWSWANIFNIKAAKRIDIPESLIKNTSVK